MSTPATQFCIDFELLFYLKASRTFCNGKFEVDKSNDFIKSTLTGSCSTWNGEDSMTRVLNFLLFELEQFWPMHDGSVHGKQAIFLCWGQEKIKSGGRAGKYTNSSQRDDRYAWEWLNKKKLGVKDRATLKEIRKTKRNGKAIKNHALHDRILLPIQGCIPEWREEEGAAMNIKDPHVYSEWLSFNPRLWKGSLVLTCESGG